MQNEVTDVTELAGIARQLVCLRRRVIALHAAMVTGGFVVFDRTMRGIADRPRFLPHWGVIFLASVASVGLSTRARARIGELTARAQRIVARRAIRHVP